MVVAKICENSSYSIFADGRRVSVRQPA